MEAEAAVAKLCLESFALGKATPTGCDAKLCTRNASDMINVFFNIVYTPILFFVYLLFSTHVSFLSASAFFIFFKVLARIQQTFSLIT